ncbi:MAG TPA: TIGR03089 family protein [Mycobacteriales bacterium]|nr:TIGR03089 family protein [Mycobacteriales bacterium]
MLIATMLARELRRDGARPLLTWYDDGDNARVELSVATAVNWAAKLANLLVDEYDVEPGHTVGVRLPAHWQTAVLLLGVWTVGAGACVGGAGSVTFGPTDDSAADVGIALDPMGASLSRIAAAQPDAFVPPTPLHPQALALAVGGQQWTHGELGELAQSGARHHGLGGSSRVLSTLGYDSRDGLDAGLVVPLAAGASVVLVTNPDRERLPTRCSTEQVTHTAGVTVDGLPRLD